MFGRLIERIKLALSERNLPKKVCKNCYYFALDRSGFKCVNLNACTDIPKPSGFCPLFVSVKAPTREQIVKTYLEECLNSSVQVD